MFLEWYEGYVFFSFLEHTIDVHKKAIRDKKHEYEKSKTSILELVEDLCDGNRRKFI